MAATLSTAGVSEKRLPDVGSHSPAEGRLLASVLPAAFDYRQEHLEKTSVCSREEGNYEP